MLPICTNSRDLRVSDRVCCDSAARLKSNRATMPPKAVVPNKTNAEGKPLAECRQSPPGTSGGARALQEPLIDGTRALQEPLMEPIPPQSCITSISWKKTLFGFPSHLLILWKKTGRRSASLKPHRINTNQGSQKKRPFWGSDWTLIYEEHRVFPQHQLLNSHWRCA